MGLLSGGVGNWVVSGNRGRDISGCLFVCLSSSFGE